MNVSSSMNSASASATMNSMPPPPRGERGGEPPSHASAIEQLGISLSEDVRSVMLSSVQEMEESGASFEEIKSFVDSELEANGVDLSAGHSRSGQLVDLYS